VVMPEMDGIAASKEIMKIDPSARIVYCRGCSSRAELAAIQQDGPPAPLIRKPFHPDKLLEAICNYLDTGLAARNVSH